MGWTKKSPTKPGFYYWQGGRLIGDQVAFVQVSAYKNQELFLLAQEMCIGGYKNAPADAPAKEWGGIWAGPLPQPRDVNTPSNAGLGPLLDSEEDPARLWAEIHLLRAAVQGPDGYATWQDAATAERVRRVKAEKAHLANEAVPSVAADVWPNEQSR